MAVRGEDRVRPVGRGLAVVELKADSCTALLDRGG